MILEDIMQGTNSPQGPEVVVHTLANGLTVVVEPLPYLHSVSAGIWIQAGSACETPQLSGISHFLEHLFFKGTETRSARDLVEALERHGGQLNGFTSRDFTCIYARALDTHLDTALDILADVMQRSQFSDFDKERSIVLEEIASVEDVPEEYIHDLLVKNLWPAHSMGQPVTGTCDSVAALSLDDVRTYFDTWYRPSNMVLAVVGNLEPEHVIRTAETLFGGMTPGTAAFDDETPQFGAEIQAIPRDIAQSHLCLGFPGPSALDPERFTYDVLSCALGGGATSRLFDRIRESEGLAYSIYSFFSSYRQSGMLGVYAAVAPENLDRAGRLAFDEIKRICDEAMPEDEAAMNREQLKGGLLMSLERTFNRMVRVAKSMMYHGRFVP
ncbi:MAG: insulinase family protein, partial [bacterium]|nr:insulinase family protein [bacterium]